MSVYGRELLCEQRPAGKVIVGDGWAVFPPLCLWEQVPSRSGAVQVLLVGLCCWLCTELQGSEVGFGIPPLWKVPVGGSLSCLSPVRAGIHTSGSSRDFSAPQQTPHGN